MLNRFWRFCFRLLYNEFAFSYDLVSRIVSLGKWRDWQRSALTLLPAPDDGLILELAHGTGDLQIDLQRTGYQTVALDLSPHMGRLAQNKLVRAELEAPLITGDAFRLPCRSRAFAAIVCTFPTSIVFDPQVLAEVSRVLKPSGPAVIVLAGKLQGRGMRRWLIRHLYRLTGQGYGLMNELEIRALFRSRSMSVESHVIAVGDSLVQVAVLTAFAGPTLRHPDISLELNESS